MTEPNKNRIEQVSVARGEYPAPAQKVVAWKPIVGAIAVILGTAGGFLPPPFGAVTAIVGWLGCMIAGVAAAPPQWAAGKPILGGAALTTATAMLPTAITIADNLDGWPKVAAQFVAMLATLGAGAVSPQFRKGNQ